MDDVVLTIDTDWAPDCAIDFVAEHLIARRLRATWFVTHMSPAIERLELHPQLFELGIHPNFLSGSTHGDTPEAVIDHCLRLVPKALSMRTHSLVQSTPLLRQIVAQTGITTDVSLFLPYTPGIRPVEYRWRTAALLRIPYFWADDFQMEQNPPCWRLAPLLSVGEGLKVFAFHPIHVYLNSADIESYRALKQEVPKISEALPEALRGHISAGRGASSLFTELLDHLASQDQALCIRDIYDRWQCEREKTDKRAGRN